MLMVWLQLYDSWVSSRALFPSVDVWWQLGDCSLQSCGTCVQEAPSIWLPWRQCTNLHQVGGNSQVTLMLGISKSAWILYCLSPCWQKTTCGWASVLKGKMSCCWSMHNVPFSVLCCLYYCILLFLSLQWWRGAVPQGETLATSQWHMPGYQQSLDVSELLSSPEILLSCVCAVMSPVDNSQDRGEEKNDETSEVLEQSPREVIKSPFLEISELRQGFEQCCLAEVSPAFCRRIGSDRN